MKMEKPLGITCVGLVMLCLTGQMEPFWLFVAVLWLFMRFKKIRYFKKKFPHHEHFCRICQMTDSLSDVNDILGVFLFDAIQQFFEPIYV